MLYRHTTSNLHAVLVHTVIVKLLEITVFRGVMSNKAGPFRRGDTETGQRTNAVDGREMGDSGANDATACRPTSRVDVATSAPAAEENDEMMSTAAVAGDNVGAPGHAMRQVHRDIIRVYRLALLSAAEADRDADRDWKQ